MSLTILIYKSLYKPKSYRLDHIAFVELGQRKVDHNELKLQRFLYKDWQNLLTTTSLTWNWSHD